MTDKKLRPLVGEAITPEELERIALEVRRSDLSDHYHARRKLFPIRRDDLVIE